jgi:hypothetical protein
MTIWMITREHEYQGGNGSWYEDYIDEDFGYFSTQAAAEEKLEELVQIEREAHKRRFEDGPHQAWKTRQALHEQAVAQNAVLLNAGAPQIIVPRAYPEPVYPGWQPSYSDYNILAIEPGVL